MHLSVMLRVTRILLMLSLARGWNDESALRRAFESY